MKNRSEAAGTGASRLIEIQKLVAAGESQQVEFKKKAAHPDKIVRELIAFANTAGGTLLIGVEDNGTLAGVPFPDEEILDVKRTICRHTRPPLNVHFETIALNQKKFLVKIHTAPHALRPVFFVHPDGRRETFVRHRDKSIKASFEMREIVRRAKSQRGTHIILGEAESKLFTYLSRQSSITLNDFRQLVPLSRRRASQKLIALVLANVLRIIPTEKGDVYTRVAHG